MSQNQNDNDPILIMLTFPSEQVVEVLKKVGPQNKALFEKKFDELVLGMLSQGTKGVNKYNYMRVLNLYKILFNEKDYEKMSKRLYELFEMLNLFNDEQTTDRRECELIFLNLLETNYLPTHPVHMPMYVPKNNPTLVGALSNFIRDAMRADKPEIFNTVHNKLFPTAQDYILRKMSRYMAIQAKKNGKKYDPGVILKLLKQFNVGHCSGFSGLYVIRKSKEEESQFFGNLQLMASWDEQETTLNDSPYLGSVFDQMINDLIILHNIEEILNAKPLQRDWVNLFEIIKPAKTFGKVEFKDEKDKKDRKERKDKKDSTPSLSHELSLSFIYNDEDFVKMLSYILKKGKMIRLGSDDHAISVFVDSKDNSIFWLYDPNVGSEQRFNNIESLIIEIKKDFHYTQLDTFPIVIDIFEWEGRPSGNYNKEEILQELILNHPEVTKRESWNKYTQAFYAILGKDIQTLDALLKANPNLLNTMVPNATILKNINQYKSIPYTGFKGPDISLLQTAIATNNIDMVVYLCKKGADVHAVNKGGWSALHYAVYFGNATIIQLLLDHGADMQLKVIPYFQMSQDTKENKSLKEHKPKNDSPPPSKKPNNNPFS